MSFAENMIASIKNNARIRKTFYDKNYIFKKTGKNKMKFRFKKATPQQLRKIKEEMATQNHLLSLKRVTALIIALLIVGLLIYYLLPLLNRVSF